MFSLKRNEIEKLTCSIRFNFERLYKTPRILAHKKASFEQIGQWLIYDVILRTPFGKFFKLNPHCQYFSADPAALLSLKLHARKVTRVLVNLLNRKKHLLVNSLHHCQYFSAYPATLLSL